MMTKLDILFEDYSAKDIVYKEVEETGDCLFETMECRLDGVDCSILSDMASNYGVEKERQGFFEGFKCAMQLLKECE